jgi:REP-associated tyrosine transposase
MPDHIHLVLTPYDSATVKKIVSDMKSASAHLINAQFGRQGRIWQRESFDHIIRSDDNLRLKCEYVAENPVRRRLVASVDGWPWLWRDWVNATAAEGGRRYTGDVR